MCRVYAPSVSTGTTSDASSSAAHATSSGQPCSTSSRPLAQACSASPILFSTATQAAPAAFGLGAQQQRAAAVLEPLGQRRDDGAGAPEILHGRAQRVVGPALAGRDHDHGRLGAGAAR